MHFQLLEKDSVGVTVTVRVAVRVSGLNDHAFVKVAQWRRKNLNINVHVHVLDVIPY